jgi:hypothetical protein
MRAKMKRLAKAIVGAFDLRDVFVFGGLGCAAFGLHQVYEPAAWIVSGAALFWLGVRAR